MAQTGYTPISLYYSSTASAAPTAGNLVAGELAINTADGKLYYKDSAGVVQVIAGKGGAGVAGGSNTQVQYNSSGSLAGSANMTFSGTALTLANDASISGLTVGKGGGAVASNTAVGFQSIVASATGTLNTAVGYQAGAAITSGSQVTAVGYRALNSNTTGASNTAAGTQAFQSTTTGSFNTGFGFQAGNANSTGGNNTGLGYQSLWSNTTASNNTAVGYQAGYSNTTGLNNLFIGKAAGYAATGSYATAIGYEAGYNNTEASLGGLYVGYQAGKANTSGQANSAIGTQALTAITTGNGNTAVGYNAFLTAITATYGTAVGYLAGKLATGKNNTFIGAFSGTAVTTGVANTFVGSLDSSNNYAAGNLVTTGSANTILGNYDGNRGGLDIRTANNYIVLSDGDGNPRVISDGSGNICINATSAISANSKLNIIGSATSSASTIKIGTDGYAAIDFRNSAGTQQGYIQTNTSTVLYVSVSDYRLKDNVLPMTGALAKVQALKPCTYTWKNNNSDGQGFIAHELQAVVPECVTGEKDAVNAEGKPIYQGIDTSFLVATLTAAIQELKAEFDAYKATHP